MKIEETPLPSDVEAAMSSLLPKITAYLELEAYLEGKR